MDDFAKFQPHQFADNQIVIILAYSFALVWCRVSGPFDYALN